MGAASFSSRSRLAYPDDHRSPERAASAPHCHRSHCYRARSGPDHCPDTPRDRCDSTGKTAVRYCRMKSGGPTFRQWFRSACSTNRASLRCWCTPTASGPRRAGAWTATEACAFEAGPTPSRQSICGSAILPKLVSKPAEAAFRYRQCPFQCVCSCRSRTARASKGCMVRMKCAATRTESSRP